MRYPVVEIEWIDASYEGVTLKPGELRPLVRLRTCGYLVREDKESVSVAMELCDEDGNCRHVTHLPRVNIVKMRQVRQVRR